MLLSAFLHIILAWGQVFAQTRTFRRAQNQALGLLVCLGRRTLSRIIWTNGGQHRSWSGEYFLYSRSPWDAQQLFIPILQQALPYCPGPLLGVAVDDTRLHKTGRCIAQASYHRDPLSPPFHTNLMLGLRFLQASLLLPLHRSQDCDARALPIRFESVPVVKKPGKRADDQAHQHYQQERKRKNLSCHFVSMMNTLLGLCTQSSGSEKILVFAGDGSFCNRTVLAGVPQGAHLIARTRKDAVLCFPAPLGSSRFYAQEKFTPEQVRQDETLPWNTARIFYGGQWRQIRYKQVENVLWQGGGRRRRLRLLVFAPLPKWRRHARRPSCLDLITLLRKEMVEHPELLRPLGIELTDRSLAAAAAA